MKKYIIPIVVIALVIIALLIVALNKGKVATPEKQATLQTIKVNEVTRSVFYAPQYVAISQGMIEEEGLKLELSTGQGADKVMTAVLAGQSDIGFAGPEASIYVYNEGKEDYPQVIAQLTQTDGAFLISREENKNFKWTDLKGKTIIPGRKGGVPYMTLAYVIRKNGMNPDTDMVLDDSIQFDLMAGAFSGGNADYVTLFEPTASMTEQAGKGYIVASVGKEAGRVPYTAYFAKKSYLENNKDLVQRFVNAIYKGQKWVESHTDREIAEAIKDFFPDSNVDLLETVVNRYRSINAWKTDPVLQEEDFNLLQTIISEAGELDKKVPYTDLVNNEYAKNAMK
ncbi:MAG: ABC transporter substrate-binding protein [Clostridia bacterium]|nr:ABC transporter substrate-binding protein [Clostridia bacterium]